MRDLKKDIKDFGDAAFKPINSRTGGNKTTPSVHEEKNVLQETIGHRADNR